MTIETVFMFPGQGAYVPGIFTGEDIGSAEAADVLSTVDEVVTGYGHQPVTELLTDPEAPPADQLMRADPGRWDATIYAASMVAYALLRRTHGQPAAHLGHSMGEIAALAAAEAISVEDGARIVCERAAALRSFPPPEGGLVAVGISADRAEHLVAMLDSPSLALAAENAPRQTVLTGDENALHAVEAIASAAGWPAIRLRSPRMQHSPLLEQARRHFVEQIATVAVRPPEHPVYSAHHDRWYRPDDNLLELMSYHLTRPVRFLSAVRHLHGHGADRFVEIGPRATLCGLVTSAVPGVSTESPFKTRATQTPHTQGLQPVHETPDLRARIVGTYTEEVQYPADLFTDEADFEADLGIDSIKQTKALTQVFDQLNLHRPPDLRIAEYRTIAAVLDLVQQQTAQETGAV